MSWWGGATGLAAAFALYCGVWRPRWRVPAFAVWCILTLVWKVQLTHSLLPVTVNPDAVDQVWTAFNAVTLSGLVCLLPARWVPLGLTGLAGFWAVIFLGDVVYYRYFQDVLSTYLLEGASQVASVTDSVRRLLQPADAWLFIDLPWLLGAAVYLLVHRDSGQGRRLGGVLFLSGALFTSGYLLALDPAKNNLLLKRFRNVAIVQRIGVLNYHCYDLYQAAERTVGALGAGETDLEAIQRQVARSRKSLGRPTDHLGVLSGTNLLVVQLESFQSFIPGLKVDGQQVTPFLNSLLPECLVFDLYDQSWHGRSSDGEFAMLNSLHPPPTRPLCYAYPDNQFYALPSVLAERGYATLYCLPYVGSFWNARHMSDRYGFQHQLFKDDMPAVGVHEWQGWGMRDDALYERVVPRLADFGEPFFAYLVTLSGHHPYEEIASEDEQLRLSDRFSGTMLADYLQVCRARDDTLRTLVQLLRQEGLWERTTVILVGDHDARIPEEELALLGPGWEAPHWDRVPFILHAPGGRLKGRPDRVGSQLDLAPTVLHLLGFTDPPVVFLGRNLFDDATPPLIASRSGYALNREEIGQFDGSAESGCRCQAPSGVVLPPSRCKDLMESAQSQLDVSQAILHHDLVPALKSVAQP